MKSILQILTVCGLFLEMLGAFYLARGSGLWQEVFRLQRSRRLGSFLSRILEKKGKQHLDPPWWSIDSFKGILCLLVGFLFQIPSIVIAIFC